MARPIKHNADYFSHDCNMRNDIKVKALRRKYKALGYATYIMMLELLTDNDYFEIEWNEMNIELLTPDFDMDTDELTEVIDYCIKLNLLQLTCGILHCDKLTHRLEEEVLKRRKGYDHNNSKRMTLMLQKPINNEVNVYINYDDVNINQESKVKESKLNEIEGKESKLNETELNYKLAKDSLNKLTEYIDDNNIPAAKKLLIDIKDDYGSFSNILNLCYGNDVTLLKNWTNYFNNTLQFLQ